MWFLIAVLFSIALATLKPQAAGYMAPGAERVSWVVLVNVLSELILSSISLLSTVAGG